MLRAVYPGSFDPVTNGHVDIMERCSKFVDTLIVAVLANPDKKSLFTVEERVVQLKEITKHLPNVEVKSFYGLLVDFCKQEDAKLVIRGLRAVTDFEYEFKMALANRKLNEEIETIFISSSTNNMFISSSSIKEIAMFGGSVEDMVPQYIKNCLDEKFKNREEN
ncbi:MAG: pantetheine-phosphate adenylyltransferase [Clostridiales bacterium]|nr:pantetheine-phosphate adenylyltransferase [Clostridiales bacterium]